MKHPSALFRLVWILALFVGLLRHQMIHWHEKDNIRPKIRWPLAFLCSLVPALVTSLLAQAPSGTRDAILDNLFTLRGSYCAFVIFLLSATAFVYTVVTAKIVKTL